MDDIIYKETRTSINCVSEQYFGKLVSCVETLTSSISYITQSAFSVINTFVAYKASLHLFNNKPALQHTSYAAFI